MRKDMEQKERTDPFKRNIELECLLRRLNSSLGSAEQQVLEKASGLGDDYPIIFVMGPLRSGTTLFMQWLANTGIVAYPTNLLSRFYGAPVIGAQIQLLLTDPRYNFRNEFAELSSTVSFESENGKTAGALGPNEFWYFWRRFLPFGDLDWLPDKELFRVVDQKLLKDELTTLTRVFSKPFALKAMILNYNIPFLDAIFDKALFVQLRRDPVANVASVLDARERQLGSREAWYSFKTPEYPALKELDPIAQAAGQVFHIDKAVTDGMSMLDDSKRLLVQYEDFCENPKAVFDEFTAKLRLSEGAGKYGGPERFSATRDTQLADRSAIEDALSKLSAG